MDDKEGRDEIVALADIDAVRVAVAVSVFNIGSPAKFRPVNGSIYSVRDLSSLERSGLLNTRLERLRRVRIPSLVNIFFIYLI